MKVQQTHHLFENRVYFSNKSDPIDDVIIQNKEEQKGAGVRSYSKIVGLCLYLFGFASRVQINGETFYLNTKSLSKFIIRCSELEDHLLTKSTAIKLNKLYTDHKKTGYDETVVESTRKVLRYIFTKIHYEVVGGAAQRDDAFLKIINLKIEELKKKS